MRFSSGQGGAIYCRYSYRGRGIEQKEKKQDDDDEREKGKCTTKQEG